ncbi:hypothetical protein VTO42DRAFT_1818 [Malbranchea cinnamomea]
MPEPAHWAMQGPYRPTNLGKRAMIPGRCAARMGEVGCQGTVRSLKTLGSASLNALEAHEYWNKYMRLTWMDRETDMSERL